MRRERIAEDLRGDVRIGRAPGVGEQAGVVGLRDALAIDAEAVGEAHGDQGAVQAVLQREPHPEVRRQAKGGDQLRAADLIAALGGSWGWRSGGYVAGSMFWLTLKRLSGS
jgi:hypothetical protein